MSRNHILAIENYIKSPSLDSWNKLLGTWGSICYGENLNCCDCPLSHQNWSDAYGHGICHYFINQWQYQYESGQWWEKYQGVITLRMVMILAYLEAKGGSNDEDQSEETRKAL